MNLAESIVFIFGVFLIVLGGVFLSFGAIGSGIFFVMMGAIILIAVLNETRDR